MENVKIVLNIVDAAVIILAKPGPVYRKNFHFRAEDINF